MLFGDKESFNLLLVSLLLEKSILILLGCGVKYQYSFMYNPEKLVK